MFRCITALKGLVIDVDSFKDNALSEWNEITKDYKCLFITSDNGNANMIETIYGTDTIFKIEKFRKVFAPSSNTHQKALQKLELETTEIAYVSQDIHFLSNAMGFLCGSIWVTDEISYTNASQAPDLICRNFNLMKDVLGNNIKGFLGEVAVFPREIARGMIIPVVFNVDDEVIPLYMLGRYFGYSHYMSQLHPYSSAIFLNKKEGKAYGKFNDIFENLYAVAVRKIQKRNEIDGICAVPPRPGRENRFKKILENVSGECKITNLSDKLVCLKDYPTQKNLSQFEREENVENIFCYTGNLFGKNVIIIDDIISTGSTMRACIRALKSKGVRHVFIVVLAVNQIQGSYWSSVDAQVYCPSCGEKMHLLINSYTKAFFYSCYNCRNSTLDFDEGRALLCEQVNREFE